MTEISPRLGIKGTSEKVEVSAEAPTVNTTSADFAPVINSVAIENLPINGGRWSDFALLTPGVNNNVSGFGLLSVRGISTLMNNNTIDGANNNQAFFSEERGRTRAGYSTPKVAVQEFQVNTSNYSAEYGRAAGGVINTVTKSGTNEFHGEAYFFYRDNAWGSTNPFTTLATQTSPGVYTVQPFKPSDIRRISGIGLGGAIIKDKLFLYFAYDWYYQELSRYGRPVQCVRHSLPPRPQLDRHSCNPVGREPRPGADRLHERTEWPEHHAGHRAAHGRAVHLVS